MTSQDTQPGQRQGGQAPAGAVPGAVLPRSRADRDAVKAADRAHVFHSWSARG